MARLRALNHVIARDGELVVERDRHRATGRLLRQGEMDSSYVDLADARHLEFDYMRWLRIILRAARARRILHIGGAACALPRALAAEWPDGRQEVCELDSAVLELARAHMGLRRIPGLRVRHVEGRAWLTRQSEASFDAVVVDAFLGARIPRRLATAEAFAEAARVAPVTLVNVVDDRSQREIRAVVAALATAFPDTWTLGARAGNTICVGARSALPLGRIAAAAAGDLSPATLQDPTETARLTTGASIRRDREIDHEL
jgi:predicted O-methyltransferase YrrM